MSGPKPQYRPGEKFLYVLESPCILHALLLLCSW